LLHRLAAKSREVMSKNLPFEGGWRAEKRKPWFRAPGGNTAGASRRANRGRLFGTGPLSRPSSERGGDRIVEHFSAEDKPHSTPATNASALSKGRWQRLSTGQQSHAIETAFAIKSTRLATAYLGVIFAQLLATAILSSAARRPFASVAASSFAQKCAKKSRGCFRGNAPNRKQSRHALIQARTILADHDGRVLRPGTC
jgi:hypothetical protein